MEIHYSKAQTPAMLWRWAQKAAKLLIAEYTERRTDAVPVFVYSGYSGSASATALVLAIEVYKKRHKKEFAYDMAYVRKKNEKSHGSRIHIGYVDSGSYYRRTEAVFVDDFIDKGSTLIYCRDVMSALVWNSKTILCLTGSHYSEATAKLEIVGESYTAHSWTNPIRFKPA